jgi:hypothetical protein
VPKFRVHVTQTYVQWGYIEVDADTATDALKVVHSGNHPAPDWDEAMTREGDMDVPDLDELDDVEEVTPDDDGPEVTILGLPIR